MNTAAKGYEPKPGQLRRVHIYIHLPVLDVVVASTGDAPRDFRELVVVLSVQLHDQGVFFRRPDLVLLDRRVNVIVVTLTALLGGSPRHHLRDLSPAGARIRTDRRRQSEHRIQITYKSDRWSILAERPKA